MIPPPSSRRTPGRRTPARLLRDGFPRCYRTLAGPRDLGVRSRRLLPRPARDTLDLAREMDYWHVNYMTRPYCKEGWSFGDDEAAYRFGCLAAVRLRDMTFEEAEEARLPSDWLSARDDSRRSWEDVRAAARDAWTRGRSEHGL